MTTKTRLLSELEGVCLGIVRMHDPCTAYRVRMNLREAPSSHWQASGGSVYPLLARLEAEGLIDTASDEADGRGRKLLSITRKGKAALKKWLLAGTSQDLISSITDPIRTRMFFLEMLKPQQQVAYLDELVAETARYCDKTRQHLAKKSGKEGYEYLGALGAVRIAEARLQWLRDVRKVIGL